MQKNMKMEQLEYFGVPHYIINIWKEHYSDFLLPVQEKAVREFNLLQPAQYPLYQNSTLHQKKLKNLLVVSPSSSGKTLVGEMAALQEISLQKKVLYLVPLRILAEEKYQHFARLYHSIGLDIKLSSRDHRHHDQDIIQGNFNIAIIVYEKFYYLLLQYPQCLNNVSLIIADEIQLINDIQRGPRLESNFNYLKNNYPAIRIIGLSAFTEHLFQLTAWLEALLLFSFYRPVELRKGIVRKGIYKYVEHNSKMTGEENFFPREEVRECDLASYLRATLQFLIEQDESSLIFFPTKKEVRLWSNWLASQFCLRPSQKAIAQLSASEDSTSKEELINLLQNGIGYHCADLSWQERHAIEEAVRTEELKIICATGTLAMGINLPVNNVILTGKKIVSQHNNGNIFSNYFIRTLTISEVENMGGRAGRLKTGHSFGRIIFLAPSLIELTAYQKLYFQKISGGSPVPSLYYYPLISDVNNLVQYEENIPVQENTINDSILYTNHQTEIGSAHTSFKNTASSELAKDSPVTIEKDILTFLLYKIALDGQSFKDIYQILNTGQYSKSRRFWSYQFPHKYSETELVSYLKELEKFGLVNMLSPKDCQITSLGQSITSKGITFQTYTHFLQWAKESEKDNIGELEILFLIATSDDGAAYFNDYPRKETKIAKDGKSKIKKWKKYLHLRMLNLIFEQQEEGKSIFHKNLNTDSSQENQEYLRIDISNYLAIKNSLIMYDWISGKELREMEEDYGILGGNLQKIGEGFSWLADALSTIVEQEGWKDVRAGDLAKIKELSSRLAEGIGPEGIALARMQIPGLTRGYIQRLVREGYNNEQCLRELSESQLEQFLPDLLIKQIKKYLVARFHDSDSAVNLNSKLNNKTGKEISSSKHRDGLAGRPKSDHNYRKSVQIDKDSKAVMSINLNRPDRIIFLGKEIAVNKIGFQLILLLAKNKGKVLSYEQIIDTLWPSDEDATYHRLWYHLAKLRKEMQQILLYKKDNSPDMSVNTLKEKLLRVIPGRGLMLDSELITELIE